MSAYPQKYRDRHRSRGSSPASTRELDARAPTDLANRLTPKVKVSCILSPEGITWGSYKNDQVAIVRLQLRANEPPGYKLKYFQLSIAFTPKYRGTDSAPNLRPSVWLLQDPNPSPLPEYIEGRPWSETQSRGYTVEPSVQAGVGGGSLGSYQRTTERSVFHKWQFRSYPDSDENNYPTTATWIWESNKANPQVEDRGVLHAAVAVHHGGEDLDLECRVEGKLSRGSNWFGFGTEKSQPARWSRKSEPSTFDVADALQNLKLNI